MKGVVAAEMPKTWPAAALQAQAVAARSYALANLRKGGSFDLFADGGARSMAGSRSRRRRTNAAVDATRGQVVLWQGKVADTVFSSSSGGRPLLRRRRSGRTSLPRVGRRSVRQVVALPRLGPGARRRHRCGEGAEVAQPGARTCRWPPTPRAASRALTAFGLLEFAGDADGRAGAARARAAARRGSRRRCSPCCPRRRPCRSAARLLDRLPPCRCGEPAGVSLEAKSLGTGWVPAGPVTLDSTGAFTASSRPRSRTQYRLAWGAVRAGLAKIAVSPLVDRDRGHRDGLRQRSACGSPAPPSSCSARTPAAGSRCRDDDRCRRRAGLRGHARGRHVPRSLRARPRAAPGLSPRSRCLRRLVARSRCRARSLAPVAFARRSFADTEPLAREGVVPGGRTTPGTSGRRAPTWRPSRSR